MPGESSRAGLASFDPTTVASFLREWARAFDDGDSPRMAAYYADDARLIGTDLATIHGRAAIERFWRSASDGARAAGVHRTVEMDEAAESGDLAYIHGHVQLVRDAGRVVTRVRYLTLWRRQADGLWRLAIDISTAAPTTRYALDDR